MQTATNDDKGYSIAGNIQRARYKLALCRRGYVEAKQEARSIADAKERKLWLDIARESRRDARDWLQRLRDAQKSLIN